jgi:hypothetical protein
MNDMPQPKRKLFPPRFSLRNLLLLMTCVALGVALWQSRQRIGPLQTEIELLRRELGYLTIAEPAKVNAIQLQTGNPLIWQWRIYLPPGTRYRIRSSSGFLPDQQGPTLKAWLDAVEPLREAGVAAGTIPTLRNFWFDRVSELGVLADVGPPDLQGEFTLDARLVKVGEEWRLKMQPGKSTPIKQPHGDWLSDGRMRGGSNSDVGQTEQKSFAAGERILLVHLRRPVITERPGSMSATFPTGDADSIVLWLEPEPPAATAYSK